MSGAREIGSRLELFVDRYLIDRTRDLELVLHSPQPAEKVLFFDRPWEGPTSTYATVFEHNGRFHLYYRGSPAGGEPQVTCYATSLDGIHWERPALSLVDHQGRGDTNIVWAGPESHNLAPFPDPLPGTHPQHRFKALGGEPPLALVSADGRRWKRLQDQPVLHRGAFDSQNVAFWDEYRGYYAAYFRTYRGGRRTGQRAFSRSTSADFHHWSDPQPLVLSAAPSEHLYTNATLPYPRAPHILLAFPNRFLPDRQVVSDAPLPGVSDTLFLSSRDGIHFDRSFPEAFIRPGRDWQNWTDRSNMLAWGLLQTTKDELSLYLIRHYRHPTAHLQRFTLGLDRFGSLHAPYSGGELITDPLLFTGRRLTLNYATSAAGLLRVELQRPDHTPLTGFQLDDCRELIGDQIMGPVRWRAGANLDHLIGKPLRLRVWAQEADLYALQFQPGDDE